jgi:hypothetical protein
MIKYAKNAFGALHKIKEREREFSNAASFHLEWFRDASSVQHVYKTCICFSSRRCGQVVQDERIRIQVRKKDFESNA